MSFNFLIARSEISVSLWLENSKTRVKGYDTTAINENLSIGFHVSWIRPKTWSIVPQLICGLSLGAMAGVILGSAPAISLIFIFRGWAVTRDHCPEQRLESHQLGTERQGTARSRHSASQSRV